MAKQKSTPFHKQKLPLLFVLIVLTFVGMAITLNVRGMREAMRIENFEECIKVKGATILTTEPPQCSTPDGRTFIQPGVYDEEGPKEADEETWEEAKEKFEDCEVIQITELIDGSIQITEDDDDLVVVKDHIQTELDQLVQAAPEQCGFEITTAIE